MGLLRELDHIILSTPVVVCTAVGVGGRFLEQSPNRVLHGIGWIGGRSAIILGVASGLPLLIYSFVKALIAKGLNAVTAERFVCLQDFKEHSEIQLNVVVIALSALPMITLSLPTVVPVAIKAYKTYHEFAKVIQAVKDSDLFLTLQKLYDQLKDITSSQAKIEKDEIEEE